MLADMERWLCFTTSATALLRRWWLLVVVEVAGSDGVACLGRARWVAGTGVPGIHMMR
jgi:hypothetical protein